MDIEFIEQKHRDDVFKLMEICGIEMAEAYQLYTNANYSLEAAMQMHFNERPGHHQQDFSQNFGNDFGYNKAYDNHFNSGDNDQFDTLYEKYKVYKQNGLRFQDHYEVKKQSGFLGGMMPKFFKGSPELNFKKQIEAYLGKPCAIKFEAGSLSNTLALSDKFPVIVYIFDFSPAIKGQVDEVLRNSQFTKVVNEQFKNFGLDNGYEIEKSLNRFVDRKLNNNSLVILRVNAVEQVEIIQKIPLANFTVKEVLEKLKLAKNTCISKDLEDGYLQRRFQQELMGNFDYQKPMSIAEKRKIAQDRQLRKKQQQQFYASMKADQEKQRKKSENMQSSNSHQIKTYQTSAQTKSQAPKRNIAEERKQIRDRLRTYTKGVNIKLRLPDGESTILIVDDREKVQYLYDFVQSIDKDIGFQKDQIRKFNIIRPYDKLNLSQHLNRTLRQVFEGSDSQNLVVSESD